MLLAPLRRGFAVAAIAAAAVLASCESGPSKAELAQQQAAAAAAARVAPPIALNDSVSQSASIYVSFMRDMSTIRGGFETPEAVQAALRRGAAYDPAQLSRGMIAYASIIALQSPEFVAGVRQYAVDPTQRQEIVARIIADPRYAAAMPGADAAAGLIIATLGQDIDGLTAIAEDVEGDAYRIQERTDPRRAWAIQPIPNREIRLEGAKTISSGTMLASADDAARLSAAATSGTGLTVQAGTRPPPYTPAIIQALSIAALAALGAGGDEARANTDALQTDGTSQFCFDMSKLNLYQCLAASRPSYEDMFCVGRHVVRDLATCTRGSTVPIATVTVSDPNDVTSRRNPPPPPPSIPVTSLDVGMPLPSIATSPLTPSITVSPLAMTASPEVTTQSLNAAPPVGQTRAN